MQILHSVWHDVILSLSFFASIIGLVLLAKTNPAQVELEDEQILFRMSFAYWLVYCVACAMQKLILPDWEVLVLGIKLTAALSYFLTFACIICLPLHRVAIRQVEE
ncbi:hypothetical protein IQ230_16715 [Gloeocapsopsis crepidinum LEGE 06123]|uniref:Uncharacterized protein n=1 Tax=Gloeocapsopsis crepidinum LEGE 06123 TaxID=588587 RepID=A0ABR9UWL4_9CHRO|nr:hypothetical protein [Gloeocapsopsis crepidinum]MBE9191965.1 hypothetical protein [Gloeocapsopsis crepidinum LEGE 06123]